jgi:hypothetical protein
MRDADARDDVHPVALGGLIAPVTGNDQITFVDDDGADKAELADVRCQQVDLALGMAAGVMRIGLHIPDRNVFDRTRLYGATEFIVDLFNLPNATRPSSLHVSTVNDTAEIAFRLIALPKFCRARIGDLRLCRRRFAKRTAFRGGCLSFLDVCHRPSSFNEGKDRWTPHAILA